MSVIEELFAEGPDSDERSKELKRQAKIKKKIKEERLARRRRSPKSEDIYGGTYMF